MPNAKMFVKDYLTNNMDYFKQISKYIFNHPELKFEEFQSAEFLMEKCRQEGFIVECGIAGIDTAFTASYGKGSPVIGLLCEYDALPGLSQTPNQTTHQPLNLDIGHGCGHNLLGTGIFATACAIKCYLEKNQLPGTIKLFGCPAEEGGSGKVFLVREKAFEGVDVALTWHPSPINAIMGLSSLAYCQAFFRFKGVSSHAAMAPHLGRSALDAVELMNIGVNFLREHVIPEARIHYSITDTGGTSPAVVQDYAEALYMIRAPRGKEVNDIFKRICKVAEGAALMTETEWEIEYINACSNYIPNRNLEKLLYKNIKEVDLPEYSQEEESFAGKIWSTFSEREKKDYLTTLKNFGYNGDGSEFEGKFLSKSISPYVESKDVLVASTDLADVSWIVPTAKITMTTSALGTSLHTWQMTAQGISSYAHKGMLKAAEVLTLTVIELIHNKQYLELIKEEFAAFTSKNPYICPIPDNVKPPTK
ncbi:amidohydrolase [Robertmurraya massiliosenegalensis]|uniref:amidohydrolase n=1 Tax=Robertmurraya massiliosenegalensis TaxID=1287657 RepID=UPI0002EC2B12|nr:amidohydrolase [Robertmurraya massiliosenegalensis]